MINSDSKYYASLKKTFVRVLESGLKASKERILGLYGRGTRQLMQEFRPEFESLISEIPRLDPEISSIWERQLVLLQYY